MSTQDKATLENIAQFLYREARFLDDEQWDDWLECYAPEASFWMPAWDDDDRLTEIRNLKFHLFIIQTVKV